MNRINRNMHRDIEQKKQIQGQIYQAEETDRKRKISRRINRYRQRDIEQNKQIHTQRY